MITLRKASERGHTKMSWLDSKHSFSFGHYHDPAHMGFGPLRVINDDQVAPGAGFGRHPHNDMEIISYVFEGALEHKDSLGTGSVVHAGDLQHMSAGSGVEHSEFNPSLEVPVHFLQIWIMPEKQGIAPSYDQRNVSPREILGGLRLIGSRDGRNDSLKINQDVDLYIARLDEGQDVGHMLADRRLGWVQATRGTLTVNGQTLTEGDGAAIENERELQIVASETAEFLLFDMTP